MHADTARQSFFQPGGDHLTLLRVYNDVCTCNMVYRSLDHVRGDNDHTYSNHDTSGL